MFWPFFGNLDPATAKVQVLLGTTDVFLEQIGAQPVDHETPLSFDFDKASILENLQVMRNRDNFHFEKFGDIANGHLPTSQFSIEVAR